MMLGRPSSRRSSAFLPGKSSSDRPSSTNTRPGPGTSGKVMKIPSGSTTRPSAFFTTNSVQRMIRCRRHQLFGSGLLMKCSAGSRTMTARPAAVVMRAMATMSATLAPVDRPPYASMSRR